MAKKAKSASKKKSAPKKPAAKAPAKAAVAAKSGGKAVTRTTKKASFSVISEGDLDVLLTQCRKYSNDASSATGSMGELVKKYADKKHLHRGAFAVIKKLDKMGRDDPGKLLAFLCHFDHMRELRELDKIANKQGTMLVDDKADAQAATADAGEEPEDGGEEAETKTSETEQQASTQPNGNGHDVKPMEPLDPALAKSIDEFEEKNPVRTKVDYTPPSESKH